jgi:hypothetical protein
MDGFKDSTRMKYMTGGPVKKFDGGGVYNERGKRATMAEIAAEDRRMANVKREKAAAGMAARMSNRKPPVEGISTRPTDSSGRRMTDKELGMTPGGVAPKKKAMPMAPASGIGGGALAGAAAGALAGAGARAAAKAIPRGMGAMSDREMQMVKEAAKKGVPRGMGAMSDREMQMVREAAKKAVPSYSDRPMIRRSKGGLTAMPKGKC